MNKAFFLDRDGVVVKQVHYLCDPEQTELEKNVVTAIRRMHELGYLVVVVTNQSGVARGKFTMKEVEAVHGKITQLLAAEGEKIDAFYICPHHPEYDGVCDCRKPAPGCWQSRWWHGDRLQSPHVRYPCSSRHPHCH